MSYAIVSKKDKGYCKDIVMAQNGDLLRLFGSGHTKVPQGDYIVLNELICGFREGDIVEGEFEIGVVYKSFHEKPCLVLRSGLLFSGDFCGFRKIGNIIDNWEDFLNLVEKEAVIEVNKIFGLEE